MGSPDALPARIRALLPDPLVTRPVLVTGVPRSGTTWLARTLAGAPRAGMPGREPMNPRGGQFGLGGTVEGWTELAQPTARQVRILRRCYRGLEPRTYSRYGIASAGAALPWRTTIVKDPFALLAVPTIVAVTGATPVVVYRHAGAVLAGYRRMGWTADTAEVRHLQGGAAGEPADDLDAMAEFWTFLHERVLSWLPDVPGAVLVSHGEATRGGAAALRRLARACGLDGPAVPESQAERTRSQGADGTDGGRPRLHTFERQAEELVSGWRARLDPGEVDRIERATAHVWAALESSRTRLADD